MSKTTIDDCILMSIDTIQKSLGKESAISNDGSAPFKVKRLFYIYDIPEGVERGAHAHMECFQFLIALKGSYDVLLKDGMNEKSMTLNSPEIGLLIPPGIWASEYNYGSKTVCLVLASHAYDKNDYISEYDEFIKYRKSIV
jgi:dTDP-4-dehydrorhamnose 3,5-epimerase-like enzyme